ncbi:MAG: ABC transporter ATP-binding protein, partial [Gammaproteobacteria bacterium]
IPFIGTISDWLAGMEAAQRVRVVAYGLVGIMLLRMVAQSLFNYLSIELRLALVQRLQSQTLDQLLRVQLSYLNARRQGELDEILAHHIGQIGSMVDQSTRAISLLATLLVYGLLLLWIAPLLTLVTAGMLLGLLVFVWFKVALPLEEKAGETRESAVLLHNNLLETLAGLATIRLFGRQAQRLEDFHRLQSEHLHNRRGIEKRIATVRPTFELANILAQSVVLLFASWWLPADSSAWQADLLLFVAIVVRLMSPVSQFVHAVAVMIRNEPALDAVLGFLRSDDKPYPRTGDQPFDGLNDSLRFESVSFRYTESEPEVIKGLDLAIEAGRFTAIVGASGAGKSTLINLIARLADCGSGCILVDGHDLRTLSPRDWHQGLAVVSQDVFLFNDSVAENIRFPRPEASDEEVKRAAELAGADTFIRELPQGYDTPLGDRGTRLSGGQRQRISISRALLAGPGILLLDEATSELDAHAEQALKQRLRSLCPAWTIIAVAHRLSSIRDADTIVVMDGGRVVESGRHEALMESDGAYSALVRAQSGESR